MRIRFNISPASETEIAIISLISSYPDGLRSELVRKLIAIGYSLHSTDEDFLSGINIHSGVRTGGIMCKFNVSQLVPHNDPAVKAFNIAKGLNSLVKPLYLNKLIKAGYLFQIGGFENMLQKVPVKLDEHESPKVNDINTAIKIPEKSREPSFLEVNETQNTKASVSIRDNASLRNSLKNLSN
jgi:hypothetical protein